jgi:hypothetical protein
MEYNKGTDGAWVDAEKLADGVKVKLVSECTKQESRCKNKDGEAKTENVAKVRVQGDQQTYNMRLNWTTVYGLIDAFWPAPGSEDTELGVLMGPEVRHGEAEVYARVQA